MPYKWRMWERADLRRTLRNERVGREAVIWCNAVSGNSEIAFAVAHGPELPFGWLKP